MYQYAIWVRINPLQTTNTHIYADNDIQCKMIAEAQYGHGNLLSYTKVT
jgi:hypothetical protein